MEKEIWLPAPGYEGYYEVSNLGRVKSAAIFIRHDGNFAEEGGYVKKIRVRNQQTNRYGYKTIKMCKLGKCTRCLVHRLIAKAFIPTENTKLQINHIDGDKTNNNVTNLEWVTAVENMRHAWETGLINKDHTVGSRHHKTKLSEADVVDMRTFYGNKTLSKDQIAEKYNINKSTLNDILYERTWKHI